MEQARKCGQSVNVCSHPRAKDNELTALPQQGTTDKGIKAGINQTLRSLVDIR
jgi:hypothetical protein